MHPAFHRQVRRSIFPCKPGFSCKTGFSCKPGFSCKLGGFGQLPFGQTLIGLCLLVFGMLAGGFGGSLAAQEPGREIAERTGTVRFEPGDAEAGLPSRFQLKSHAFDYAERPLPEVSRRLTISMVTFPSPVKTTEKLNNTVHCEYYQPRAAGKRPAVVVLHILGGDFELARLFCNALAQRGTAALFLKMPYYGPRRTVGSDRRMISRDPRQTVEGMTRAILDIRRATVWLAARDEVDPEQLGVFGISLGGITGALAAGIEPRLNNVCLLLAGGDMGQMAWQSPKLAGVREQWQSQGGTKKSLIEVISVIDPVKFAPRARDCRILMLNARDDEIVPRACTESLWEAFGRPEIVWYTGGHYSVGRHIFNALFRVGRFFEKKAATEP